MQEQPSALNWWAALATACGYPHELCRYRQETRRRGRGWHSCEANPCWHLTFEIIIVAVSYLADAAHFWGFTGKQAERATHSRTSKRSDVSQMPAWSQTASEVMLSTQRLHSWWCIVFTCWFVFLWLHHTSERNNCRISGSVQWCI